MYVSENVEECVRGITEEEFEETYHEDADNVPFDNLNESNYKDLRVLDKLFETDVHTSNAHVLPCNFFSFLCCNFAVLFLQ